MRIMSYEFIEAVEAYQSLTDEERAEFIAGYIGDATLGTLLEELKRRGWHGEV